MEKIEYGPVTFNVIRTVSCERTRVKDKQGAYLWTHWDFTVECNFQPAMAAYTRPPIAGNQVGAPVATPGTLPGVTDVALLNTILQPCQFLRVTAGGSVILQTPDILRGVRLPCDCTGGPSCELVGVPMMIGIRHWVVRLRFVADVREPLANFGTSAQSVVISNLWVSMEDIDFQRRSVRRFAGRAVLRADLMRSQGVNANSFRDLYLFPCPDHYQRGNVTVQISEDGTVCEWSFEDAMRGYDLGVNSPIVSIECFRTGYVTKGSPLKANIEGIRNLVGGLVRQGSGSLGPLQTPAMFLEAEIDNLPRYYIQTRCDLVGDRNANLGNLTKTALGICLSQMSVTGINDALTATTEITFRQDIADQVYTSVEMTKRLSDDVLIFAGVVYDTLTAISTLVANNDASAAALGAGSQEMIHRFQVDSTGLATAAAPGVPIADRSGAPSMKQNPPLRQGAYGVVPAEIPNNALGSVPGAANAIPTGNIPAGIVHLIVQALLGPNQTPTQPGNLLNDS